MKARSGTSGGERVEVDRKDELSPFSPHNGILNLSIYLIVIVINTLLSYNKKCLHNKGKSCSKILLKS